MHRVEWKADELMAVAVNRNEYLLRMAIIMGIGNMQRSGLMTAEIV